MAAYQAISELSAFESPVRPLMVTVILVHSVLLLAFGVGVLYASRRKASRGVGGLLIAICIVGFPTHTVWAMSSRNMEPGFNDTMHIILSAVLSVFPLGECGLSLGLSCARISVRERPTDRFASVNDDMRTPLDLGLRIWKAGWVHALAGSNPASSANPLNSLTCGNAVQIRSARDGVASKIEAASLNSGRSFRPPTARNPAFCGPGMFAAVRRRTPRLTSPPRKRAPFSDVDNGMLLDGCGELSPWRCPFWVR
jgi:Protein of unknown function (DUF998)